MMKRFWLVLIGVTPFLGYFGWAQINFTGNITVSGTAPSTNTDNSALTNLTSIKIYRKVGTGVYSLLTTVPFTQAGGTFTYADNGLANNTYCYRATALNSSGNESALSVEACRQVLILIPSVPTNVTAQ